MKSCHSDAIDDDGEIAHCSQAATAPSRCIPVQRSGQRADVDRDLMTSFHNDWLNSSVKELRME